MIQSWILLGLCWKEMTREEGDRMIKRFTDFNIMASRWGVSICVSVDIKSLRREISSAYVSLELRSILSMI